MTANQGVRYCGACGASNPNGAGFCNKCGQPMALQGNTPSSATNTYPQAPIASKRRPSAFGRVLRTVGLLLVVGIIADVAVNMSQNHSGNSPSSTPGAGTHICTTAHYDKKQVTCTSDDRTITSLDGAYLSTTGQNGNNFTASTLDVLINKENSDGSYSQVASAKLNAGLAYTNVANTLANIFVTASAAPDSGATYQIEVDEGSTNLGTAMFTYKG